MNKKTFIEKHFSETIDCSKYFKFSKKRLEVIRSDLDALINSVKEDTIRVVAKKWLGIDISKEAIAEAIRED